MLVFLKIIRQDKRKRCSFNKNSKVYGEPHETHIT